MASGRIGDQYRLSRPQRRTRHGIASARCPRERFRDAGTGKRRDSWRSARNLRFPEPEALQSLAAESDAEWRDVARLGDTVASPKLVKKAARKAFDVYLYGTSWYAIPTGSETFDPVKAKAGIYNPCYRSDSRQELDRIIRRAAWIQSTPHFVKVAYRRMLPVVKRLRSLLGFGSNRPFDPNGQTEQLVARAIAGIISSISAACFSGSPSRWARSRPALAQSEAECPYLRGPSIADVMYQIRCEIGVGRLLFETALGSFPVAIAALIIRTTLQNAPRLIGWTRREPLLAPAERWKDFPVLRPSQ